MSNYSRLALTLLFLGLCIPADANPGSRNPGMSLSLHGWCSASKETAKQCYEIWKGKQELVASWEKAVAAKDGKGINVRELGPLDASARRLSRLAGYLMEMGEPAGVDFQFRSDHMKTVYRQAAALVKSTPAAQKLLDSNLKKMDREAKARARQVEKMMQQVARGQLVQVEKELVETLESHEVWVDYFGTSQRDKVFKIYQQVEAAVMGPVRQERMKANLKELQAALVKHQPDLPGLQAEIQAAVEGLASAPTTTVGGAAVSGPEAFEKLFSKWQIVHLGLVRCEGIQSAINVSTSGSGGSQANVYADVTGKVADLMLKGLPALIAADAQRATAADAQQLYMAYIGKIAPLAQRTSGKALAVACAKPLDALAGKAGEFAKHVQNYSRATDDILLWRSRTAAASAKAKAKEYPEVTRVFAAANTSSEGYVGILPGSNGIPALMAGADRTVPMVVSRTAEQKTMLTNLTGARTMAIAGFRGSTYANVPVTFDTTAQKQALAADLLVNSSQPALTLESAMSLTSASANNFAAAGGAIKGLYLEGMIPRFANLPPTASILLPLGKLAGPAKLAQMLMRFDVMPDWVQHEHFFLDVPSEP